MRALECPCGMHRSPQLGGAGHDDRRDQRHEMVDDVEHHARRDDRRARGDGPGAGEEREQHAFKYTGAAARIAVVAYRDHRSARLPPASLGAFPMSSGGRSTLSEMAGYMRNRTRSDRGRHRAADAANPSRRLPSSGLRWKRQAACRPRASCGALAFTISSRSGVPRHSPPPRSGTCVRGPTRRAQTGRRSARQHRPPARGPPRADTPGNSSPGCEQPLDQQRLGHRLAHPKRERGPWRRALLITTNCLVAPCTYPVQSGRRDSNPRHPEPVVNRSAALKAHRPRSRVALITMDTPASSATRFASCASPDIPASRSAVASGAVRTCGSAAASCSVRRLISRSSPSCMSRAMRILRRAPPRSAP